MQKEKLTIGVHSTNNSSYAQGIANGFKSLGLNVISTDECLKQNIVPNLTIGFDKEGLNSWQKFLNKGVTNIMWASDSIFANGYDVAKQFSTFKNFILLNSTASDNKPVSKHFPSLVHGYLPLGVDTDYWCPDKREKDIDILVYGNLNDADKKVEELKNTMPELVFNLMMEVINIALINPSLSIQEICEMFQKQMNFEFSDEQIFLFLTKLPDIITTKLYEKVMEQLQDTSLTLAGSEYWKKYEKENRTVLNVTDNESLLDAIRRSRIVIFIPEHSTTGGINATILKIASAGGMILTPFSPLLKAEFDNTLAFYNPITNDDLKEKIKYYLKNSDQRQAMCEQARFFATERHSWKNRAKAIFDIIDVK